MSDMNDKLDQIGQAFEEFKSANDARLAEIESKGSADALTNDKVERINTALSELQEEVSEIAKKSGRLGASEEGKDEYEAKFNDWARTGEGEREVKAMATEQGGGDVVVPRVLDTNIIEELYAHSAMRQLADVISVTSRDYSFMRSNAGAQAGWVGETDERPETNTPALSKVAVTFGEMYANPAATQISLDDAAFDLNGFLARQIANVFGATEGAAFINGNGTDKPTGVFSASTGIEQVAGSGVTVDGDDALALFYALDARKRANASFLVNPASVHTLRTLKDANGNYLWQPSLQAGQPATLLGKPIYEDDNVAVEAAGALSMAFGDFKAGYVIADRLGTRMLRDPYTNKPYVHFYTTKVVGGQVVDASAIKLLKLAAS
ncbi:phage major capsid protein [Qipengyuania citrea]|uniref:phage major capsid protein n=1 Tax=Qipengyuania citrea TaxID=225971 RepID=UPI001E5A1C5C|nr:phage major capsid protein [Qipengyuania citrea]MCD1591805.1 phage major capsid protein [Qipengyuania citrea]